MTHGKRRFQYSVWQDGMRVAFVDGPHEDNVKGEIMRYAVQYAQEGPVIVRAGPKKSDKVWAHVSGELKHGER